jgi:autotransporter passenger strand-loop-strand repeat protein
MTNTLVVPSGQTSAGLVVNSGVTLFVASGGETIGTKVNAGGVESVLGGKAIASVVTSGGEEEVASGGTSRDVTLSSGGREDVFSGSTDFGTVVNNGAFEYISAGGIASGRFSPDDQAGWRSCLSSELGSQVGSSGELRCNPRRASGRDTVAASPTTRRHGHTFGPSPDGSRCASRGSR